MDRWPDDKLARTMLTDAGILERAAEPDTPAADAACHIKSLLARVRELERENAGLRAENQFTREVLR